MKILFVSSNGQSPVRIYRGEGVLNRLRKLDPSVELVFPSPGREMWVDLLSVDVVYFLRCTMQHHVELAMDALNMGVPIWYDLDDDMFSIPPSNPASEQMTKDRKDRCAWFLVNSMVVTVSTKDLQQKVGKIRGTGEAGVVLVPNALDDYAFPDLLQWPGDRKRDVVLWRGGVTHQGDLLEFAGEFWKFFEQTPETVKVNFVGYQPFFLAGGFRWLDRAVNFTNRMGFTPYQDYFAYMGYLRDVAQPATVCVPLVDDPFNRSKSNIALLEAIYAGAVPVVPDWEEWDYPEVSKYSGIEDFSRALLAGYGWSDGYRKKMWEKNIEHLKKNHLLSEVNKKRMQVLEALKAFSKSV